MPAVVLNVCTSPTAPFAPSPSFPLVRRPGDYSRVRLGRKLSALRRVLPMDPRTGHEEQCLHPSLTTKLPMEVVLTIFEFAVRNEPKTARAISLVCRHARTIAAPEVYRTVSFSWGANLPSFLRFALSNTHLCPSIHNLWLGNHYAPTRLLSRCSNLERIAMEPQSFIDYCTIKEPTLDVHFPDAPHHPINARPPLRAHEVVLLSYPCDWSDFDPTDELTVASLQSITHLWLTRPTQLFTKPRCRRIVPCLSRVSHLGIKIDTTPGSHLDMSSIMREVKDSLELLPTLKMLVVIIDYDSRRGKDMWKVHDFAKVLRTFDGRVHVLPMPVGSTDFVAMEEEVLPLFKAAAAGKGGLWDKAREFREELGTARSPSWLHRVF